MNSARPPAPKFDPALPLSSWLWPKFQIYLAAQKVAAAKRPKVPGPVRLLLALPLLVILADVIGVTFFGVSTTIGARLLVFVIAPRILLETAALAGLVRRDLLGRAQSVVSYLFSVAAYAAFIAVAFELLPWWFFPLALVIIYGPRIWRLVRRIRAGTPAPATANRP